VTPALASPADPEIVHCRGCGRLLRRRARLSPEQRAQALALRWAAARLEADPAVDVLRRRRKNRGDADETFAYAVLRIAETLREWARTVHKRPPLAEAGGRDGEGGSS
jgi:hypothetical protein